MNLNQRTGYLPGLPWAVALGSVDSPAQAAAPALWPTDRGGLGVSGPSAEPGTLAQALEAAAFDLLLHMPAGQLSVQVFDFSIRKRFPSLAQLQPMGLYTLFDTPREAEHGLSALERLARRRHHELLDDRTPTLAAYNETAASPQPYVLVLLNLDNFPSDAASSARMDTLFPAAAAAGIFFLAFDHQHGSSPAGEKPEKPKAMAWTASIPWLQLSPQVDGGDTPLEILTSPGTQAIHTVLARHGATLSFPTPSLAPAVQWLREQAAAQAQAGELQDFVHVQVGTSLDGRHPVHWTMGPRCGNHHALLVGMSGMGKSTLLNNLVVGIAEQYTAHEVRLFLMDYKDGVEFQSFSDHPNVERIFLDNEDTGAATQLLREFAATIHARNGAFRSPGVQVRHIDDYNRLHPTAPMPRLLLVVDEAQRLLAGNGKQAVEFAELLVDVTRRGRSAGVHIVLATQSLDGIMDANRLLGAISLRVSFKLNAVVDAERAMSAGNAAALELQRFEFVMNGDSGQRKANVLARGLPQPDIKTRLAAVRAQRAAADCIMPIVATGLRLDPSTQPSQQSPSPPGSDFVRGETPGFIAADETAEEEALLRALQRHGITPQRSTAPSSPPPKGPGDPL